MNYLLVLAGMVIALVMREVLIRIFVWVGTARCWFGHEWKSFGGRPCPRGISGCSQPAFVCVRCKTPDYGYPGGPGAEACGDCDHSPCDECEGLLSECSECDIGGKTS